MRIDNAPQTPEWEVQILHDIVDTPEDGNVDVVVTLRNGDRYGATFFTMDNIKHLFRKFAESGECVNGLYFWATDMVLVQRLDRWTIEQTIAGLVAEDLFTKVFGRLRPVADDQ
jgi:hypothetical protein